MTNLRRWVAPLLLPSLLIALSAFRVEAAPETAIRPPAIMEGYPAFDAKYFRAFFRSQGVRPADFVRTWLDTKEYQKYGAVVILGSLPRARMDPTTYSADDLRRVEAFMTGGGTLVIGRGNLAVFSTTPGRAFLARVMGPPERGTNSGMRVMRTTHPWVKHLVGQREYPWMDGAGKACPRAKKGEIVIGNQDGDAMLYRVKVGKGQLIYFAWDIANYQPQGRRPATHTIEKEVVFAQQIILLKNVIAELYPARDVPGAGDEVRLAPYTPLPPVATPGVPVADRKLYRTHRPMRPLPAPSSRPKARGPAYFVDTARGSDKATGTEAAPWKTLQHAVNQLKPGDTLYLRGGTYYERVRLSCAGTYDAPITVRSYPGELAVIDGGIREFYEAPAKAWEPCPGGAKDEYRSTKGYAHLRATKNGTNLMGNFGESMVPLHGYRNLIDLRSTNPYWTVRKKMDAETGIYCGPGLWYDIETGRIHIRISHVALPGLGKDRYRGETDPCKLRLIVAGRGDTEPLTIRDARHVRFFDMVVRGSCGSAVDMTDCRDIVFDGMTVYGGSSALTVHYTRGFRVTNSAFRGVAAPWTFRAHLKYRGVEARFFTASKWLPTGNADFEIAYSEFTDSIDGIFIGNVDGIKVHHSLVDNCSDDGFFVTAQTDYEGNTPGGPIHIYQNHISRCLTMFAYGVGHGRQKTIAGGKKQLGDGVWVTRNVFDNRHWVGYQMPTEADGPMEPPSRGRSGGDHGSPIWEPMYIYNNTIVTYQPAFRAYYLDGWGSLMQMSTRRLFNNILCQSTGIPGAVLSPGYVDLETDANLHWSAEAGDGGKGPFQQKLKQLLSWAGRQTPKPKQPKPKPTFPKAGAPTVVKPAEPKKLPPPAPVKMKSLDWAKHDLYADPKFVQYAVDVLTPNDYRLQEGSPAVDAGVPVPEEWFDPLRKNDRGKPDLGAFPAGVKPWGVGVRGRLIVFGPGRDLP